MRLYAVDRKEVEDFLVLLEAFDCDDDFEEVEVEEGYDVLNNVGTVGTSVGRELCVLCEYIAVVRCNNYFI